MDATTPDDLRLMPISLWRELRDEGWPDRTIRRRVDSGEWARPRPGAYVDGQAWARLSESQRHEIVTRAAVRQSKVPVLASHVSGAVVRECPTWGLDLSEAHLTRVDGKAGRRQAGICQHRGLVIEGDVTEHRGLPVVSPARLAVEITMVAGVEPALAVVNDLLFRRLVTPDQIEERYEQGMAYWPNSLRTDLVMRLADGRVESLGETRVYFRCFSAGLPMPQPQVEVFDERGELLGRVDFAWPALKVFLEFDGKTKYTKYLRAGESVVDVVLREKRREEAICARMGWTCIRVTWADLQNPERLVARIAQALGVQPTRIA